MLKIKTLLSVAVAVSGATLASSCLGQMACDSCSQAQFAPVQAAVACDSCGPVASAPAQQFSYPSRQVRGCGQGGCSLDELKAKWAHQKAINAKIAARNDAWPMPFDCADRQVYFSFWQPMINQGWEEQCVLTSAHFDQDTNQLNKFGQTAVAGIMQNHPTNRRTVYIHRDVKDEINQARRTQVQDTINTFYGHTAAAQVAFSNKRPVTTTGVKGAQIQEQWLGSQPTPAISVSSGGTVADSVSN